MAEIPEWLHAALGDTANNAGAGARGRRRPRPGQWRGDSPGPGTWPAHTRPSLWGRRVAFPVKAKTNAVVFTGSSVPQGVPAIRVGVGVCTPTPPALQSDTTRGEHADSNGRVVGPNGALCTLSITR